MGLYQRAGKKRQEGKRRWTTRLLTSAAWAVPFASVFVFSYKPPRRTYVRLFPVSFQHIRLHLQTNAFREVLYKSVGHVVFFSNFLLLDVDGTFSMVSQSH